jgi:hypothetical protein
VEVVALIVDVLVAAASGQPFSETNNCIATEKSESIENIDDGPTTSGKLSAGIAEQRYSVATIPRARTLPRYEEKVRQF